MHVTEETATDAVVASFAGAADPRLRELLSGMTRYLHDFIREYRPTVEEWRAGVEFLTRTGQACTDVRQEFILLSDVFGVSSLVETINGDTPGATESTVLGPFHIVESPSRQLGESIDLVGKGEPCVITGVVRSANGAPLVGASIDVWQADENGFYDVQQPDLQPRGNNRGLFTADDNGRFWFRTVTPRYYPIPHDGPVGDLLTATERHPNRPAHIHFIVEAPGHRTLTTHLFNAASPYIDSDPVFAVKTSLVREFDLVDDPQQIDHYGFDGPFRTAHFEITVEPVQT